MKNRFLLICAATLSLCAWARSQPMAPPEVRRGVAEAAPVIEAEAQALVERMVARYAELQSYSEKVQLRIENAAGQPVKSGMSFLEFEGVTQWQRPAYIRFEGTNAKGRFVALGTPEIQRVISPDHPDYYVARPRNPDFVITAEDGTRTTLPNTNPIRLEEPLMGNRVPGGPGGGFLLDAQFFERTLKEVRSLQFEADGQADGQACRVVNMQFLGDDGSSGVWRVFIAKSDGLLRRIEARDDHIEAGNVIVETHSDVQIDPDLPAATWNFEPPAGAKRIDYFSSLDKDKYAPALKVGATLPIFSGDALDGKPLELNPQNGKVTIVHFFTINSGFYDVQTLSKLQRIVGPDKLQIVGVSGDGVRSRVEEFAARYQTNFPIYFDERATNNPLFEKFGVKSWPTTLIFGPDGKLQTVKGDPRSVEYFETLRKLLPGTPADAFTLRPDEFLPAP